MAIANVSTLNTFLEWLNTTDQVIYVVNGLSASANVANGGYTQANTARDVANLAYAQANTDLYIANLAFDKANTANTTAVAAFNTANTGNGAVYIANLAFDKANTAANAAIAAFNQANTDLYIANLAFDKANTGGGATYIANLAFDKANTSIQQGYLTAFIPAQALADDLSGTLTPPGSLLNIYNSTYGTLAYYRQFSGTANNYVGLPFNLPKGARTANVRYRIIGFPGTTDGSSQSWILNACNYANGTNVYTSTGQTTISTTLSFTATTANSIYVSAYSAPFKITSDADGVQPFFTLYRDGTSDASTVAFNMIACEIQYTANASTDA